MSKYVVTYLGTFVPMVLIDLVCFSTRMRSRPTPAWPNC